MACGEGGHFPIAAGHKQQDICELCAPTHPISGGTPSDFVVTANPFVVQERGLANATPSVCVDRGCSPALLKEGSGAAPVPGVGVGWQQTHQSRGGGQVGPHSTGLNFAQRSWAGRSVGAGSWVRPSLRYPTRSLAITHLALVMNWSVGKCKCTTFKKFYYISATKTRSLGQSKVTSPGAPKIRAQKKQLRTSGYGQRSPGTQCR